MKAITDTNPSDLPKLAICHKAAFRDSLSSKLGRRFLIRMLSWYFQSEKTFLFHLEAEGICAGFCGGIINDQVAEMGSSSSMTQHSIMEAMRAALVRPWLFFSPELRKKFQFILRNVAIKAGFKSIKPRDEPIPAPVIEPHVGLVVIGIHPRFQGMSLAAILLSEFERRATEANIKLLQLTVLTNNQRAIRAYEKYGWFKFREEKGQLTMRKLI